MASNTPLLRDDVEIDLAKDDMDFALARLEREVGVPVVSGEGVRWLKSVLHVLEDTLDSAWGAQMARNQRTMEKTLKTDIELAARVEKLRAREEEVARELHRLARDTKTFCKASAEAEGSREPTQRIEGLRESWLNWIVQCRALTKEVQTWFVEASYRETGTGD